MHFPRLVDIATKTVVTIDEEKKLEDAVSMMHAHGLRDIVITKKASSSYGLITANDLIRFKLERVSFDVQIKELKIDRINTIKKDATLLDAFKEVQSSCNCLCLVDNEEKICGFITYTDIISSIDPAVLMKEQKIRDMLWGNIIKHTTVEKQTYDTLRMMSEMVYDAVIIYDQEKAVGIITTKDTIKLINSNADLSKPISTYMTSPIRTIDENTSIQDALEFIKRERFKRVIVSNKRGEIIGQISQQELLARIYSRWAESLKAHDKQLAEVNRILEARASKFEQLSQFDGLTGLANRTNFEEKMLDEFERIERYGAQPFSLIFFDIDHFKQINDRYGHLVGDQVLKSMANLCKGLLRKNDVLSRWGGEEFVIILPCTDGETALQVAEKLRHDIEIYIFEQVGLITCSFGVSQYRKGDTPTALLHRTDSAMYEAKQNGRNRVISG